jgi:hypothetical protein
MENPNNLSAVEFLHSEYKRIFFYESITPQQSIELSNVIEKAKEMFEQQIIDAGNTCALKQTIHNRKVDLMSLEELEDYAQKDAINVGEEYYNETFKNQLQG